MHCGVYQNSYRGDHVCGRFYEFRKDIAETYVLHTVGYERADYHPYIYFDEFIHARTRSVSVQYAFYHSDVDKQNAYRVYLVVLRYGGIAKRFARALQYQRTDFFVDVAVVNLF